MSNVSQSNRPQETCFYDMFQNSPDPVVIQDSDGVILNANEAFAKLCGQPRASVMGSLLLDLIAAEEREAWAHKLDKLIRGEWTTAEGHIRNPQGRGGTLEIMVMARTTYAGKAAVIFHFHDISAFYTVERALVASQSQWERSFDTITDYMCLLDRSGHILRANRATLQRFKPRYPELAGLDYRRLFRSNLQANSPVLPDAVTQSPYEIRELTFVDLDGIFSATAFPLKGEQDLVTGAILIVRDITEQYKTAQLLKKSQAGLQQIAKMGALGRLARGIAHDFNNLLTPILGYASLLLRNLPEKSPLRNDVQAITRAAESATSLIRQLTEFSQSHTLETKILELNPIIENIIQFLPRSLGDKIQLITRLDKQLWPVKADASRLEQVVVNLAVNARDAMPQGGKLIIETSNQVLDQHYRATHPEVACGNYVTLAISDTGQGMPPHVMDHIFEPFFTTKPKGKGTGMGLTTVYGIVRQFGGHINCYSEVKRGTTFKIYLPQAQGAVNTNPTDAASPEAHLPGGHETILVVDDEAHIADMVSHLLTELGYQTVPANSGREAQTRFDQAAKPMDLVITDIVMPEMNGVELVKQLRQKKPELKALYMSGYTTQAALQIGVLKPKTAFLQKPFNFETLAQSVRNLLDAPA